MNKEEKAVGFQEEEPCRYEVNRFEKKGVCNLCGYPRSEHFKKKKGARK